MTVAVCAALVVAALLSRLGRPRGRAPGPAGATAAAAGTGRRHRLPNRRLLLVVVAVGGALTLGPLATAALAVTAISAPRVHRLVVARSAQRAIDSALPDAIELLVLVIHAGLTPHQAIEVLARRAPAPVRAAFAEVRRRVGRGTPLADALEALPATLGPNAHAVADTMATAERHGTPIARILEQLALDVRERRRRQAEAEARKLPIRMSFPLVTCTLPAFVLVAIVPAVLAALTSLGDTGF